MHAHDLGLVSQAPEPHGAPTTASPHQGSATVTCRSAQSLTLQMSRGVVCTSAHRAASCLLQPEVGDLVWFVAEGEQRYVTAVLRRGPDAGASQLRIDGDADLRASGQLTVGGAGLDLHAEQRLGLHSDELQIRARRGRALLDECSFVLRELFVHATKATFVGKLFERLVDRISSHSKSSLRVVEGLDQVQAGNLEQRATGVAQLAGKTVLLNGTDLVKADGGQIHLG